MLMSPACCLPSPENDVPSLPFWPPSGVLPPPPIDWFGHTWLVQRLVHDPSWANGGPSLGFWTWKGRECQSVLLSGGGYETRGPGLISCQQQGGSSAGRRNKLTRGRDEEKAKCKYFYYLKKLKHHIYVQNYLPQNFDDCQRIWIDVSSKKIYK